MKIVRIVAKRDGFRRAGIAHPGHPVDHGAERFTRAQLAQLKAEPMLVVQELDLPDEPAAGKGGRAKSDG